MYLWCVVRETFRMHPMGPFIIPHESMRATKVMGYGIPTKTPVFINTHTLVRYTRNKFRSEWHLLPRKGEGEQQRVEISHRLDFKILPFSAGKRKCPGAPLGMVMVMVALATHQ
ncbi:hypothetical protein Cni_G09470 [Canna indica]|uniref:Cytochrome P450 n=1 Tax=Canna indica TaxID=4628 RepID=A0AAQ3K2K1_9LILI|nr:hypothetical protein Cni_G09470 [Canna indica]